MLGYSKIYGETLLVGDGATSATRLAASPIEWGVWHVDGSEPSAISMWWTKWGTAYEGATACHMSRVHVPSRRLVVEAKGGGNSPLLGAFNTLAVCEIYIHLSAREKIVGITIVPLSDTVWPHPKMFQIEAPAAEPDPAGSRTGPRPAATAH